ncbi:MAG: hypothetical protein H8E28_07070 [Anaerolineae bacterium]|nr:hypothetical protein [Anaerolineae bacterium]MBL6965049.1 hypothetical protein [Anaerolineales bacterium]
MKKLRFMLIISLLIIGSIALSGCTAETDSTGLVGAAGPPGPMGPAGPQGETGPPATALTFSAEYAGSRICSGCHTDISATFGDTGHAWGLSPIKDSLPPDYPFTQVFVPPDGYNWEDISFVIGGYNWKALFVDQQGYLITAAPDAADDADNAEYLNQYNFANSYADKRAGWVSYHAGEAELPFDCGACHTTGYSPKGNQNDQPGFVGTWSEAGIQCEACHGPGSLHAKNPEGFQMLVDRDAEACGECHVRGVVEEVDAEAGFIQHHEQFEELFQSKHIALDCVLCHDPHTGVVQLRQRDQQTTRTQCEDCHFMEARFQNNARHAEINFDCVECHMPRLVQSAWANLDLFTADIRTHEMAIDPYQVNQFNTDGTLASSQISLDYACRHCHVEGMVTPLSDAELLDAAINYHSRESSSR